MKLNKFLLMMFASLAVLISCSSEDDDSPITPSNTDLWKDYFPMSVGSYWIYESFDTDENYETKGKVSIDSVVVTGIKSIGGKEAYEITRFSKDTVTTEYYYGSGSKLYAYGFNMNNFVGDETIDSWGMIADFDLKNPITLLDTSMNDIDTGEGMFMDFVMKATMTNGINKSIEIMGKYYNSYALEFNISVNTIVTFMDYTYESNSDINSAQYFVKKIGLCVTNTKTYFEGIDKSETTYTKEKLIRYHIAK